MRDPKRIDLYIEILRQIWKKNPDLRFLQLIFNIFSDIDYYKEDDKVFEELKKFYL